MEQINSDLSTTLRGAKFFVTGDECTAVGLNLNCIPGKGVNLSVANQTLLDGFLTAKQVFEHVEPKSIKFVFIGLSPSSDDILPILEDYFKLCRGNGARPIVVIFPVDSTLRQTFDANILQSFRNGVTALVKKHKGSFVDLFDAKLAGNSFQDKRLLNEKGAAEAGTLLVKALYRKGVVSATDILSLNKIYRTAPFKHLQGDYKAQLTRVFCDIACKDFKRLSAILPVDECKDLMARVFSELTYTYLFNLSDILSKDDYNDIATRVFAISAEKIRCKDKIKVGFVLYDSSMWCGDDLYNFFAQDERFEPTIFLCLRSNQELVKKDFFHGVEQFKSRGLNVVAVPKKNDPLPAQNILIFLTPYFFVLANAFRPENLSVKTLMVYIPYALTVSRFAIFNYWVFFVSWKAFFSSSIGLKDYDDKCRVGMPRGLYTGYPRMDVFFKDDADFKFDWKMTRPDAKKIIWAPHWSISSGVKYATFQWNYKFMYEFAKAHPEISWVVKPHPNLFLSAIQAKLFSSVDDFEKYFKAWSDLPNAQVCTGGYYQALFATSDGMIHDSGSFIAEYQYVDKPMIYLTRDTQKFNELGEAILEASYCVDGQDLDSIAAMIQRVFIDGDDYKAADRRKVFDASLNYPKENGMLASEFIYKSIADDLKAQ